MLIHPKTVLYKAALLSMVLGLLGFTIALAASGDLDSTFDGDGLVTSYAVPSNPGRWDSLSALAVQADGKIIAAGDSAILSTSTGDFAILRYTTGGLLDATFNGDGRLLTNFGGRDAAFDVALQANGKIVAVGNKCNSNTGPCDVALARYNANGTLDTTFSGDGKQITDFGGADNSAYGLAIQSNGKIVVAGYLWNGTDYDFAVFRYLSSGSLDTTFSGDGMVNIGFSAGKPDFAEDLVIQSNGKIVVAGITGNDFAVARLNAGGSLDTTFSGDGKQITNFGGQDRARSVALQTDGRIIVAGEKFSSATSSATFAMARYNVDGSPDTTFNATGKKVFIVGLGDSSAWDLTVQPDGKIVVAGIAFTGAITGRDFALARLNSLGTFDTTFSGDGKVTVDFGGFEYGFALAVQPSDGKYIIGGPFNDGSQGDFALARVLP